MTRAPSRRPAGPMMKEEEALAKKYGATSEDDFHRGYVARLVKGKLVRGWWQRYQLNGWRIYAFHNPLRNATVCFLDRAWAPTPARECRDTLEEALQFASAPRPPAAPAPGRCE